MKAIAVHPEMMYSAVRRHSDNAVLVIASERLAALNEMLGPHGFITELSGQYYISLISLFSNAGFSR